MLMLPLGAVRPNVESPAACRAPDPAMLQETTSQQPPPVHVARTITGLPATPAIAHEIARALGAFAPMLAAGAPIALHVTAASAGAGVSTVARELAAAASRLPGCKPLLLDTKRDGPALGLLPEDGLPDLLATFESSGRVEVADIRTESGSFHAATLAAARSLATGVPHDPPFAGLHAALRHAYHLTILDCHPVSGLTGFLPVVPGAAQVLLVIAAGRTRAGDAVRARILVERLGGELVGAVMNRRRNLVPGFISRLL